MYMLLVFYNKYLRISFLFEKISYNYVKALQTYMKH